MRKIFLLAALVLVCRMAFAYVAAVAPVEGIQSFHTDIQVFPGGVVRITEHIQVYTERQYIRKGIFRKIPVYRKDAHGHKKYTGITVTRVLRDGQPEPYQEETENGMLVIRIGNPLADLQPGFYRYAITYESRGHVGFFDGYDELYWNVTGNEWKFPIVKASAAIQLPAGANVIKTACYTGRSGSGNSRCSMQYDTTGIPVFTTEQVLQPGEGFTIAVAFTAGLINRPPPPTFREKWQNSTSLSYLSALAGGIFLFIYCYVSWRKYGRDALAPATVPSFEPPDGLSPAVLRYYYKKRLDGKAFAAALISMAVKKAICISKPKDKFVIERGDLPEVLVEEEKEVYDKLLKKRKSIQVTATNYKSFSAAQKALEAAVKKQVNLPDYYRSNTQQAVSTGIITAVILMVQAQIAAPESWLLALCTIPFSILGTAFLVNGLKSLREGCTGIVFAVMGGFFIIVSLIVFSVGDLPYLTRCFHQLLTGGYGLYLYLIPAYTPKGAQLYARIRGFRMYLSSAEERLNMPALPEQTPYLFERLLPYAIALDLENKWGKKFMDVLEQSQYTPEWYAGTTFLHDHFTNSLGMGFISSVSTAQVNPAADSSGGSSDWSSGSSGGSSGGGGGGGGGW